MTNLSDLFPAGAGKQVSFVADGSISAAGKPVLLTAAGKAAPIVGTAEIIGSDGEFEPGYVGYTAATFDSNSNKVVVGYQNASSEGVAAVGTVSGTSISFGTPVVFETPGAMNYLAATFDSVENKVVFSFQDSGNSSYGTAIVGTVSGTSISFGTPVVFNSATTKFNTSSYDANAQKVLLSYHGTSSYGYSIVGTVSGTSISFGSEAAFNSAYTSNPSSVYDSNAQKVVIGYGNSGSSGAGTAIVATISGTSVSFGTPTEFQPGGSNNYISLAFDSANNKIATIYQDTTSTNYGHGIVGTVSGTGISFGTSVVFNAAATTFISASYDVGAGAILVFYRPDTSTYYGEIDTATISGTSISFGTEATVASAVTDFLSITYDSSNEKVVVCYKNDSSSTGVANVVQVGSTNLTAAGLLGISDAAISDTASGNITVKGGIAVNGLTSLTIGSDYYVQADGSISTVTTSPAVKLGRALSATSIDLEYQS